MAHRVVGIALALAVLLTAGAARAASDDPQARAQAAYDEALAHYQAGRFEQAALGFEAAYDAVPHGALLWNIGRSWEQAGELEKARDAYRQYLGAKDVDPELQIKVADALVRVGSKLQARQDARTYEERVAQLRREIAEAEAERNAELVAKLRARLDDEHAAETPPEPPPEAPPAERAPPEPAAGPTTVGASLEPERRGPTPVAWVALGVGAVAAGVGAWLLVDAEGKRDDVRAAMDGAQNGFVTAMSLAEARQRETDANRNATLGIATLAVGGAAAVTGAVLAITTRGPRGPAVSLGVTPGAGGGLITAAGRF